MRMRDHHPVQLCLLSQPSGLSYPLSEYFNVPETIISNSVDRVPKSSGVIVVTFDTDTQCCTTVVVVVV